MKTQYNNVSYSITCTLATHNINFTSLINKSITPELIKSLLEDDYNVIHFINYYNGYSLDGCTEEASARAT